MLGIGGPELVVILIVGLIFIGPDKLPAVAKTVGGGLRDLRRAANLAQAELRQTVDDLIREADLDELNRQPSTPAQHDDAEATIDASANAPPGEVAPQATHTQNVENPEDDAEELADAGVFEDALGGVADAPDPGFTFDDDPDDWDPDAFDDSAEPAASSPTPADTGATVSAPTALPSEAPAETTPGALSPPHLRIDEPPTQDEEAPPGPLGTRPRSFPPMRDALAEFSQLTDPEIGARDDNVDAKDPGQP